MSTVTDYLDLEKKLKVLGHTENTVWAVVSAMASIDKYGLSDDEKHAVYSLLSSIGFEALSELPDAVTNGEWEPFNLGNVAIGDYVRIKKDAYTAASGVNHNGKVGRLAHMYAGRCTVHYIGIDTGDNMVHPVGFLESLKRV